MTSRTALVAAVLCLGAAAVVVVAQQPQTGGAEQQLRLPPQELSGQGRKIVLRASDEVARTYVRPLRPHLGTGARLATISVTYTGFTAAAQAAFQAAVDVWASQITSTVPISIAATYTPLGPGILGQAGPHSFRRNFPNGLTNTWYPVALANKRAGFDLDTAAPDIDAQFSSNFSWYFGTDGNPPPGTYDFMTVVLHELGHGLGFLGLTDYTTASGEAARGALARGAGGSVRDSRRFSTAFCSMAPVRASSTRRCSPIRRSLSARR